jgi:hypothetical protein
LIGSRYCQHRKLALIVAGNLLVPIGAGGAVT